MKATSEELAIFVAVVESGSFSRAAEQLGQANSAVSRAVKKLEMKLGVSLLNRTTRQRRLLQRSRRQHTHSGIYRLFERIYKNSSRRSCERGVKGTKGQAINPTQGPDLPG